METETKISFWHKQAIWIHFTLVYLGIYFSMSLIIQAYQVAFPSKREQVASNVAQLLDLDSKSARTK